MSLQRFVRHKIYEHVIIILYCLPQIPNSISKQCFSPSVCSDQFSVDRCPQLINVCSFKKFHSTGASLEKAQSPNVLRCATSSLQIITPLTCVISVCRPADIPSTLYRLRQCRTQAVDPCNLMPSCQRRPRTCRSLTYTPASLLSRQQT